MNSRSSSLNYLAPKYWGAWLIIIIGWSVAKIPYSLQIKLSKPIGKLLGKIGGSRIEILVTNISLCFPELSSEEQHTLVQKNLRSTALFFLEIINLIWAPSKKLEKSCEIVGYDAVEQLMESGRGILFVTGHMHATAFLLATLCSKGPTSLIYRELGDPVLEKFVVEPVKKKLGIDLIGRKDMKNMLDNLSNGGLVVIVPDQDLKSTRSTFVPFFGVPALTITTVPDYARQTNAAVVVAHAYRHDDRKKQTVEFEVLDNYPSDNDTSDTQIWSDWLESVIRRHPDQYLWIHQRFKRRPDGEESVY